AQKVLDLKDFEALETAANQRLLASLGFGGELFDDDEDRDLERSNPTLVTSAMPAPDAGSELDTGLQSAAGTSDIPSAGDEEPIAEGERRHIENLAQRAQVEVPELRTRADVKAAQRKLSQLSRQRRANG